MPSRLEINTKRLLNCCEEMANDEPNNDWRLKKYLESLEEMLIELQKQPISKHDTVFHTFNMKYYVQPVYAAGGLKSVHLSTSNYHFDDKKPSKDTLSDYNRRLAFLKGLIHTTKLTNPVQKVDAVLHLSHGAATTGNNVATKEIHQKTTTKYGEELRNELFLNDNDDTLRNRNISKPPSSKNGLHNNEDMDSLLRYHQQMQEKVAENMLLLTRNLKEQTQLASKIIKQDTETLKSSSKLSDTNMLSLESERERLAEQSRKAWKCWLWIMLGLVMAIFINMVLFMKIIKKKV